MSDGDNATPGRRRRSDPGDDNHWLTRTPRPSLGAAPWERGTSSESEDSAGAKPTGNHTDGVTVADLIAKVTGISRRPGTVQNPKPNPIRRPPGSSSQWTPRSIGRPLATRIPKTPRSSRSYRRMPPSCRI